MRIRGGKDREREIIGSLKGGRLSSDPGKGQGTTEGVTQAPLRKQQVVLFHKDTLASQLLLSIFTAPEQTVHIECT